VRGRNPAPQNKKRLTQGLTQSTPPGTSHPMYYQTRFVAERAIHIGDLWRRFGES